MNDKDLMIKQLRSPEKPGKILAVCPLCKKKEMVLKEIVFNRHIIQLKSGEPAPSLQKIVCLSCGIEYYGPPELLLLNQRVKQGESKIITLN